MTTESLQFTELIREHYARLEAEKLAKIDTLLKTVDDERTGKLTPEQAREERRKVVKR